MEAEGYLMLTYHEPTTIEEMLDRITANRHYISIKVEVMQDICERILALEEQLAKVQEKVHG